QRRRGGGEGGGGGGEDGGGGGRGRGGSREDRGSRCDEGGGRGGGCRGTGRFEARGGGCEAGCGEGRRARGDRRRRERSSRRRRRQGGDPMNRIVLLAALACAALAPSSQPAMAQPAMALGRPLPDPSMPVGTVSVRVIAGTPAAAVPDAEVTLLVNDKPQTARSDGSGRATFSDLPPGATVQATILDEQQKPQMSEAFPVPPSGGTRLMLATKPFAGAPASHALGGGAPGMQGAPEARAMSGQPRPDRTMEPGSYQIRLTYNNLSVQSGAATDSQAPAGEVVTLVGYRS